MLDVGLFTLGHFVLKMNYFNLIKNIYIIYQYIRGTVRFVISMIHIVGNILFEETGPLV